MMAVYDTNAFVSETMSSILRSYYSILDNSINLESAECKMQSKQNNVKFITWKHTETYVKEFPHTWRKNQEHVARWPGQHNHQDRPSRSLGGRTGLQPLNNFKHGCLKACLGIGMGCCHLDWWGSSLTYESLGPTLTLNWSPLTHWLSSTRMQLQQGFYSLELQ